MRTKGDKKEALEFKHLQQHDTESISRELSERMERAQEYANSLETAARVTEQDLRMQVCL